MSYDVQVLVNGSRCKQYNHNGKIFVEAKKGSEYTIEIKNNTWQRVLAVCSVDGLDILNGKPALEDNPGYVISGYATGKFDGFRVSNEKVAKFVFDYKGNSYAASKEDNSERNVGVIGVRIFQEKSNPKPIVQVIKEEHHHHHHDRGYWPDYPYYRGLGSGTTYPPTIWCDNFLGDNVGSTLNNCCDSFGEPTKGAVKYSCDDIPTKSGNTFSSKLMNGNNPLRGKVTSCALSAPISKPDPKGFDMGTKWGEAKESRVIEVEFERGILTLTTNIYYASRQSLIEMGVPLNTSKQVNFPSAFKENKYCVPPSGWKSE